MEILVQEQKTATITATSGLTMECTTAHHEFDISGAPTMGGDGRGVDPAETLLAALGACALVIAKSFARIKGINLKSISVEITGTFEDYGFEFLQQENKTSKVGFSHIDAKYFVDADNDPDAIEALIKFVEGNCPVRDTLENPPTFATEVIAMTDVVV